MKPFNLEEALAGKSWGYTDGTETVVPQTKWKVIGRTRKLDTGFLKRGSWITCQDDIGRYGEFKEKYMFMLPEVKKVQMVLVKPSNYVGDQIYAITKELSTASYYKGNYTFLKEFEIEYEEKE